MMMVMMMMRNKMTTNSMVKVFGANGAISKPFRKYLSQISGVHANKELQTTALLGDGHILREVGPV